MALTPDQVAALRAELRGDPLNLGYAAHLPDDTQRVIDSITAPTQIMVKAISAALALEWAASGPYPSIVDAANNPNHPCRASCLALRDDILASQPVDLSQVPIQQMFDGWVLADVITQAQHDLLMSMATQPASRAEVLGLPAPSAWDILDAWGQ